MAQNLTHLRRVFYGIESTEGTRVAGTATTAILPIGLTLGRGGPQFNTRAFRGQLGNYTGKMGEYPDPNLSMEFELRSYGGGGALAATDLDELYKTVFGTRVLDTGGSTLTGGDSTTTSLHVGSSANFTVGNAVLVENGNAAGTYEMNWISAIPDGTHITLVKALTATPTLANGSNVKPTLTYSCANSGHQSLSFDLYDAANAGGGAAQFISLLGCKGSLKLTVPGPGAIPKVSFDWHGINWQTATNGTVPSQTIGDSGVPTAALASLFKLDATKTDVKSLDFDLAASLARKKSQNSTYGTYGQVVTNYNPAGAIVLYNADYTQYSAWTAGTAVDISMAWGNTLSTMVGIHFPNAQRVDVADGDDSGMITDQIKFQAGLTSGLDMAYLAFG